MGCSFLAANTSARWECPQCGYTTPSNDDVVPEAFFRPWHVVYGRQAVKAYVASLGEEAHEWLLALYVDEGYQLLAVDTVARGGVSNVEVPSWALIERAKALKARGFILVHNHPSGDARPSEMDIKATGTLAYVSYELDVPLLDHLIVAGDELRAIGHW
jgi:DNA repair protein RadC